MPTLESLLEKKIDRLESVPAAFSSNIEKVQLQLLKTINSLLAQFDVDENGNFIINESNITLAGDVDIALRKALDQSDYAEAITEFAKEFNSQIKFNDAYFQKAFAEFNKSDLGAMVVKQAQSNAVTLLINSSPDSDFIIPIKQQIEQAVINGARWAETLDIIQQITTGTPEQDGKILAYSKQIAHDTFAVADRSYASAVAEQVGATWFKYSGGKIKTSRPFCVERHNQFFCKKEIELWGGGHKTEGFIWPKDGTWAGEMDGTNERTIFATAGGYNCMHSIMAISISRVPKEVIQRAIENGYYEPTQFEIDELGL